MINIVTEINERREDLASLDLFNLKIMCRFYILLLFVLLSFRGFSQVTLKVKEMKISNYISLFDTDIIDEDFGDGPYVYLNCVFVNHSSVDVELKPEKSTFYLKFNYKGESFTNEIIAVPFIDNANLILKPDKEFKVSFGDEIFLGTTIFKDKKSCYLKELVQVLPTMSIIYKQGDYKIESHIVERVTLNMPNNGKKKYWEELNDTQKSEILKVCKSEPVTKFYKGDFIVTDNDETFQLIEELTKPTDALLPLYFYLFNKICYMSDGALSEMVGRYSFDVIAKHPVYVFQFFKINDNRELLKKYAMMIGYELYFKEKGTSSISYDYKSLKKRLAEMCEKKELDDVLKSFWLEVDKIIERMKD